MILAIDVYYTDNKAKSVCIAFNDWTDEAPTQTYIKEIEGIEEYIPGEFYKRELPCILAVLEGMELSQVEAIVVDGFVILDDAGKYGLGAYLYESLDQKIPIVGVAKRGFHQNEQNVRKVLRGESLNPLFVTSIGIDLEVAAQRVKNMHGDYRFPSLLKILDQITKEL